MAYGLGQRFPSPPPYYRFLDPGAYQNVGNPKSQKHKAPFLSNTPRYIQSGNKLWTHAIYNTRIPAKIINCTSLKSKLARFPYEALTKEDLEFLLCQCGVQNTCECSTSEHEEETILCQGKIPRRIFKGPPPRIKTAEAFISKQKPEIIQPPFYDARVIESTSFYRGWKWSQWTSKRSNNFMNDMPGPADYTIKTQPSYEFLCAEKVRAFKRKTSKQMRFIEKIQCQNTRESLPGPATYTPKEPKGTNLNYLGPKAERFLTNTYDTKPGPSDHWIKRDFEPHELPEKLCHAHLPLPAPFGTKAVRLKPRREEGPSPASYDPKSGACKYMRCSKAPFGVSSIRFKETIEEDDTKEDENNELETQIQEEEGPKKEGIKPCLLPTWEFRSQTVRMKPLSKRLNDPSPADLPQSNMKISRSAQLQNVAPFFSSNDRFRPWYNWIPVHNSENTPGPCYYCLEKPTCFPAVRRGPLFRSLRFKNVKSDMPGPNEYSVGGGIEQVLATHNERLKRSIKTNHMFSWKPRNKIKIKNLAKSESMLLQRSIELLNEMET